METGMSKPPTGKKRQKPEIELVEDAWPRFERLIKQVAKAGPKHRTSKKARSESGPLIVSDDS
jgi:hypothetical protein